MTTVLPTPTTMMTRTRATAATWSRTSWAFRSFRSCSQRFRRMPSLACRGHSPADGSAVRAHAFVAHSCPRRSLRWVLESAMELLVRWGLADAFSLTASLASSLPLNLAVYVVSGVFQPLFIMEMSYAGVGNQLGLLCAPPPPDTEPRLTLPSTPLPRGFLACRVDPPSRPLRHFPCRSIGTHSLLLLTPCALPHRHLCAPPTDLLPYYAGMACVLPFASRPLRLCGEPPLPWRKLCGITLVDFVSQWVLMEGLSSIGSGLCAAPPTRLARSLARMHALASPALFPPCCIPPRFSLTRVSWQVHGPVLLGTALDSRVGICVATAADRRRAACGAAAGHLWVGRGGVCAVGAHVARRTRSRWRQRRSKGWQRWQRWWRWWWLGQLGWWRRRVGGGSYGAVAHDGPAVCVRRLLRAGGDGAARVGLCSAGDDAGA